MENGTRVFVYGSLMSGLHNHDILARGGAVKIGDAVTTTRFGMADLGSFPAALAPKLGRPMACVPGELYEVGPELLARLDRLEGVASGFYSREFVTVRTIGGAERAEWAAFIYVLCEDSRFVRGDVADHAVPGCDWRRHHEAKERAAAGTR